MRKVNNETYSKDISAAHRSAERLVAARRYGIERAL
jgi:hypothetical protein